MQDGFLERVESMFQVAADLPPEERDAYLDRHCAEDPALRAKVEALLTRLDRDPIELVSRDSAGSPEAPLRFPDEEQIGPYRLLNVIGEGGFGLVYLARQDRPVRRVVALKVLKAGMDTGQVVARFEAERQAMALMDHPGIAHVFDAGATSSGRPYFVMEHVSGERITAYADRRKLTTAERLALFLDVCDAVQHAHQRGIIHRDLKPSNLLVETKGDRARPKVIDFGIAKALSAPLTERTLFTEAGQMIGTPEYMSPEQAEPGGQNVDTRSDIYSLGVILYELLTGTLPFEPRSLRGGTPAEIQQRIREQEPERPSTRVSTRGDDSAEVARNRRTDPKTLRRTLRGDLDWITMKALEKDPSRRYASASELAADVQRYLDQEPVLAGPPSAGYRIRKFVRRNRTAVVAAGLVSLALVAGIVGTTWGLLRARSERDDAVEAREETERLRVQERRQRQAAERASRLEAKQREVAEKAVNFLVRVLGQANPEEALRADTRVRDLLDYATVEVGRQFGRQPEVEARLRWVIGHIRCVLGEYRKARPELERALDLLRRLPKPDDVTLFRTQHDLWVVRGLLEGPMDSVRLWWETWEVGHRILAPARFPRYTRTRIEIERGIAEVERSVRERFGQDDPQFEVFMHMMWMLAAGFEELRMHDKCEAVCRELLRVQREVLPGAHPAIAGAIVLMGRAAFAQGRREQAEKCFAQGISLLRRIFPPDHWRIARAECLRAGYCDVPEGRFREAEAVLVGNCPRLREALRRGHPYVIDVLECIVHLYTGWNRPEQAARYRLERAIDGETTWKDVDAVFSERFPPVAAALTRIRRAAAKNEKDLRPALAEAVQARRKNLTGQRPEVCEALVIYADLLTAWACRPAARVAGAAVAMLEEALEVQRVVLPADHRKTALTLLELARLRESAGDFSSAAANARESVEIRTRVHGAKDPRTAEARSLLGACLFGQGRFEDAEAHLSESYRILIETLGYHECETDAAFRRVRDLYEGWDRRDRTAVQVQKLSAIRAVRPASRWSSALYEYGVLLLDRGEYSRADQVLVEAREASKADPQSLAIPAAMSFVAALRFRRAEALRRAARVLEPSPPMPAVRYWVAKARARLGDPDGAARVARPLIDRGGPGAELHADVAIRLARAGRISEATKALEEALARNRHCVVIQAAMAWILARQGQCERALTLARQALAKDPFDRVGRHRAWMAVGCAVCKSGRTAEALDPLRRAADGRLPPHRQDLELLVEAFLAAGRADEARRILERGTRDWSEDAIAWEGLATLLVRTSRADAAARRAALEAAGKAVELSHGLEPHILATLAEAQYASGQVRGAVATARSALEILKGRDSPHISTREIEKRIERYRRGPPAGQGPD